MARKVRSDFIVVKGESRAEGGLCTTLGWNALTEAMRAVGRLAANEEVEKVRLHTDGLDVFICTNGEPMRPSSDHRRRLARPGVPVRKSRS